MTSKEAREKIDELEKLLEGRPTHWSNILHDKNKELNDLEAKLEFQRKATKSFSNALNEERLRHGVTEEKLEKAVEGIEKALNESVLPSKTKVDVAKFLIKALEEIEKGE